jgi:hypothetical protein
VKVRKTNSLVMGDENVNKVTANNVTSQQDNYKRMLNEIVIFSLLFLDFWRETS